jgi:hypothetical protein
MGGIHTCILIGAVKFFAVQAEIPDPAKTPDPGIAGRPL